MKSSKSSMKILNNKGDLTDPCGTPAGQICVDDRTPGSFTCCVLAWRKLFVHSHSDLLMLLSLSFDRRIEWSTRSKALLKSINKEWIAFFPPGLLSVSLNHVCVIFTRVDTVDQP